MSNEKIKVMIVDDHPLLRVGVASIVNARSDMTVMAQTGTGEEAVALFSQHRPDVTLMDLRLPKMSGVDAILAIRARCPVARFVVLTTYEGDEDIHLRVPGAAGLPTGREGHDPQRGTKTLIPQLDEQPRHSE